MKPGPKRYLVYHVRGQSTTLIAAPCLYLMERFGIWNTILRPTIMAFVVSCVFWYVDKWIFSHKANATEDGGIA